MARQEAQQILTTPETDLQIVDVVSAATLYARAGAAESARTLLPRLERASREAPTAWNRRSLLAVQGEIALAENHPKQALAAWLAAQTVYPQAPDHVGLALAYDAEHDWSHTAEQWQHTLDARGEMLLDGFSGDWVLAHLQLARVQKRLGNNSAARGQYEDFLKLWQQGDDLRQRHDARNELQALVSH